jgi:hypothetical protein
VSPIANSQDRLGRKQILLGFRAEHFDQASSRDRPKGLMSAGYEIDAAPMAVELSARD